VPLGQLQRIEEALAAYAHIQWGLSREQASTLIFAHQYILRLALTPTRSALNWNPPHDIRTAITNLDIDPVILRSVCCPGCFKQYSLVDFPAVCSWKQRSRCRKLCGESLLATRWTSKWGAVAVARRHYSLQSFDDWLSWFIQRPGIEELLEKSWTYRPPADGVMRSLWDTPAWRSSGASTPGKLTLGVFYDSFNPLHNKIAGKVVSCGVIIFVVLNLPHELWRQPGNFYVAGFTPLPGNPSPVTISALMDPIIDMIGPWHYGKPLQTPMFPNGRQVAVDVAPVVADKLAAHKLDGFGSHSCHYFCSDCLCSLDELERTDIDAWTLRSSDATRAAAAAWTSATTLKARKMLFRASGIRGSSMHRLAYRDHVRYHTTGIMHNLYEGVLQHHFRRKWGFADSILASDEATGRHSVPTGHLVNDRDNMEVDLDDAALARHRREAREVESEVDHLRLESINRGNNLATTARYCAVNTSAASVGVTTDSSDPDYVPSDNSDETDSDESDWDSDSDNNLARSRFQRGPARVPLEPTFDAEEIEFIRQGLAEMIVPAGFDLPPLNIGEKKHGKLKAKHWYNLFCPLLPHSLIELWTKSPSPRRSALLQNYCDLAISTIQASSFTTSSALADSFLHHFVAYRKSLKDLWPNLPSVPNHHYAMHLCAQMKFWGPPMLLSEFPFESAIGVAQDISTNSHYGMPVHRRATHY